MFKNKPFITYQTTIQLPIEIYSYPPTQFIIDHTSDLLPTWKRIPNSILIILLYAKLPLEIINQDSQTEKQRLKQEFLQLGNQLKYSLHKENCFIEIIEPQEGKPINSNNATINFDMIAIIHQILGFNYYHTKQGCKVLNHPIQKTAIYPSILISDTDPIDINNLLQKHILNNSCF